MPPKAIKPALGPAGKPALGPAGKPQGEGRSNSETVFLSLRGEGWNHERNADRTSAQRIDTQLPDTLRSRKFLTRGTGLCQELPEFLFLHLPGSNRAAIH